VALNLIQNAAVGLGTVSIKFGRTIKISSIKKENIIVQTTSATPTVLNSPFKTIDTLADFNSISRTLKLLWNVQLEPGTEYSIRLINFFDAANEPISEEQIVFTTLAGGATPNSNTTNAFNSVNEPALIETLIEDKSIRVDAFSSYQIIAKNPNFYIKSTDPVNGDFYLDNDHSSGRIKIVFSERPASNFLNNSYFKVQKKKVQRQPSRWENVPTQVAMHSWKPEVYLDFPSQDATPSFFVAGKEYFETGYKYRIIVSKEIGV
jgi:hypothetical protein